MYYYLCVKEPEGVDGVYPYSANSSNIFITYTFGSDQMYTSFYAFSLGYIYKTASPTHIRDNNGTVYKIEDVKEYLHPYDFKLDEDAERLIETKKKKGDDIHIYPLHVHDNGSVTYECNCFTVDKSNRTHQRWTVLTQPQADVIRECYRLLRKEDGNTQFWRRFFKDEIRNSTLRKRLEFMENYYL